MLHIDKISCLWAESLKTNVIIAVTEFSRATRTWTGEASLFFKEAQKELKWTELGACVILSL